MSRTLKNRGGVRGVLILTLTATLAASPSLGWGQPADKPAADAPAAEKPPAEPKGEQPAAETKPAEPIVADPLDWPNWRGPQQTSVSLEKNLPEKWDPKGGPESNLLWKRSDLGTRSTPIVLRGKLYVLVRDKAGSANEREKVVCVDAATGEQVWQHAFNVYLTDTPAERVGWSSVVGDPTTGRIYAQGVGGYFCCLEGDTGKVVWDRSLSEELGVITTYGGRTNVPVVFEDMVLISAVVVGWGDTPEFDRLAVPAHRFMAFEKGTGELRWMSGTTLGPPDTTFSTPTVKVVGGEAQLIFGSSDGGVHSMQPRTGKLLWSFPFSRHGIDVSPLVVDDTVYISHRLENTAGTVMGGTVALDAKLRGDLTGKQKWLTYGVVAGKSSPIMVDGKLWQIDDRAKVKMMDPATGKIVGTKGLGAAQHSTPLYADGKVYACTVSGQWYVLKPTDKGAEIVHKLRLSGNEENYGSPVVSHGRIYLPTANAIYCIGVKDQEPTADPPPAPEAETPVAQDDKPALVQVWPFDVLLKPEETVKLSVRLYNARGQYLRDAKPEEVKFAVQGPGEVAADGTFTAAKREGHVGALVTCQFGELSGKARVRVIPAPPWQFDFDKDENVPISWIGGRVRYVLRDVEGQRVAVKLDLLPTPRDPNNKLGTRSQMYMGSADMSNYTVQADVFLAEKEGQLAEKVGLNNSGYTLCITTGDAKLALYSWGSHDYRTQAEIPFDPQPGVWYRMKLRVEQVKKEAHVKGKIWLRDQTEPTEWMLQMVDKSPIRSGSPGIYGNAQRAEYYLDNLSVAPNE